MSVVKRNVTLVCGLLALGLMLISLGSAFGVTIAFPEKSVKFKVEVSDGQLVLIQEGTWKEIGIKNLTATEKASIILINSSSYGLHIKILTQQAPTPTGEKLFEIAEKDEDIRELVAEKSYRIIGWMVFSTTNIAKLLLEVEGKYYGITLDLNNERVKNFQEQEGPWLIIVGEDK